MSRREEGFTLVELSVVVAIIGVLVTLGIVSYKGISNRASDRSVQLDLITALKVQTLQHLETGQFSDDADDLRALEPNLLYSSDGADETVVVVIEQGREALDVCVFAQSGSGTWFAAYHSSSDGDRYAQSGIIECLPGNVNGWSREVW